MRTFSIAVLLVAIGVVGFSSIQEEDMDPISDWIEYLIETGNAGSLLAACQVFSDLKEANDRFNEPGELGFDSGVTAGLFVLDKFDHINFSNNRWLLNSSEEEGLDLAFQMYCPQAPTNSQS